MDDPPLYSAEQIEVFDGLAEILKEYTKAVIRAQPANIYQFSKDYFEAKVNEKKAGNATTVNKDMLRRILAKLGPGRLPKEQVEDKCKDEGFSQVTLQRIYSQLEPLNYVDVSEFIALACSMISQNFHETIQTIMEVETGSNEGKVITNRFMELLTCVARRDPAVSQQQLDQLREHFHTAKMAHVTFNDFKNTPFAQELAKRAP